MGASDPVTALLKVGNSVIERIWPDATERDKQKVRLAEIAQTGDLARLESEILLLTGQMQINMQEAQHKSIFVAGWRPFCGWVGGVSFAYATIFEPIMRFVATMVGYTGSFPELNTTLTMQILFGMLGLGVMRSVDKSKKVSTESLK